MRDSIELPFCPRCGAKTFDSGSFKPWLCNSCDFKFYPNVAAAAGVFILNDDNEVLFNLRAHDPGKGKLGLPGGFIDANESAEDGVHREVKEEVGLVIDELKYICSFPNQYFYGGICYNTLDLFYTAKACSEIIETDPTEVSATYWRNPHTVSPDDMAFPSYRHALKVLLRTQSI
ncbi:MAG: NUDIX domain-containing protein [Verrucomicrobia bacterium]|nr:NUDIX domain-containing protein [Verrucomicrobiota bacterium]MDA1069715.1 NUDIX domain-containing protein [Verrucomicrobiota bacterium]